MQQKLPVDSFKWVENTSQFNKGLIEKYNENCDEEHFLKVDDRCLEKLRDLHNELLLFLPTKINIEKVENL